MAEQSIARYVLSGPVFDQEVWLADTLAVSGMADMDQAIRL